MKMLALSAATVLLIAPAGAAAQVMYKCTGANGKPSFSDRPCAAPGVKQEVRGVTLEEQAARLGVSGPYARRIEFACQQGDLAACQSLEDIRTPAPDVSIDELAVRWRSPVATFEAMQRECRNGDDAACLRLERVKRSTPESAQAERNQTAVKACAAGNQKACDQRDDPERAAAEKRAKEREQALARYTEECRNGDRIACRRLEVLKKGAE